MKTEKYFKKTNKPKLNIFKLIIIILFLFIFILIPVRAKEEPCTVLLGDFMVTLINLEREGDAANLEFSVTKVGNSNSGRQSIVVCLIDDHENKYKGSLSVDLENAPDVVLNVLPKGFTYVDKVDISIPKVAPIVKIRLGDREVPFKDVKLGQPQFMTDFGDLAITKGQSVPLGKWLSFTMEQAIPKVPSWELLITIENKEYNPLPAEVRLGVQNRDGTISWGGSLTEDVAALSKTSVSVSLPLQETPPQPKILMLEYVDRKAGEHIFKVFPMPPGKLLPFPVVSDKIYEKWKEGRFTLGLPVENEQFTSVSGTQGSSASGRFQSFEKGRIYVITSGVWTDQVITISGAAHSEYLRLNFEASWLGFPVLRYNSPETGYDQYDFEGGYIATTDGKTFHALPYEQGRIAFVSDRDGNREIYVTDACGRNQINLTNHPSADMSPAWSPDGTKIAFVSDRQPQGIYIITADGRNQRFLTEGRDPAWLADSSKIIFIKGTHEICIVKPDGTDKHSITIDPASARVHNFHFLTEKNSFSKPSVSPDSSTIAFAIGKWSSGWPYRICLMQMDGTGLRNLKEGKFVSGNEPSWSPEGQMIVFRNDPGYSLSFPEGRRYGGPLDIVSFDTAVDTTQLPKKIWSYGGLDWSPDGASIAFSGHRKKEDINESINIFITCIGTNIIRKITEGKGNNWDPSWLKATKPTY
ncbi:hypothetical protein KJ813_08610 [bacterium]|nr:hypothetical protein [bacterium]MBU4602824.1 hypothetical protein [bacterium]